MKRVEGYSGIIKDSDTGAFLNSDIDALRQYKALKKRMSRTRDLEKTIDELTMMVKMLQNRIENLEKKIEKGA